MRLTLEHSVIAAPPGATPSQRVMDLAAMFGLGVDEARRIAIVPRCTVELPKRGGIVLVTGPSGSGKSTILQLIAQQCADSGVHTLWLNDLAMPEDVPLIDSLGDSLEQASGWLSLAGLGDAFVMLRTPAQLSDGQRARLRVAHAMSWANRHAPSPRVILADEFAATLDRLTARTISCNMRRWIDREAHGCTLIAATTHDDVLELLQPDVLIYKGLGEVIEVLSR